MRRLISFLVIAAVLAAAAFFMATHPQAYTVLRGDRALEPTRARDLENGKTLFNAGGCASCHATSDDETRMKLSGGKPLVTPFGTFHPPNISPDKKDGIGEWSEAEFIRAMREGVSPQGQHYYPAFPYSSYRGMSADDVADIFAYLKSLPAVEGKAPTHDLAFPFSIRQGVGFWKLLYLTSSVITPDTKQSAEWNRGRYLVESAGHCAECHSPRNALGAIITEKRFSGGPNPEGKGRSPNLTQDKTGLANWSEEDLVTLLKDGFTPDYDSVGGSMAEVVRNTSALKDEDRQAMAVYLKSLAPIAGEARAQK